MVCRPFLVLLSICSVFCVGMTSARADMVFSTPAGSQAGGQNVNASATFSFLVNQISVAITNNQANPTSDIQSVNGISFSLNPAITAGSILSRTDTQVNIDSNGDVTAGAGAAAWNYNEAGLGIEITSIGNSGGSPTLIGDPDNLGVYSNANGSIAGSGPHNPFLQKTVSFLLSIPGVTPATTVTEMRFQFGTSSGDNVTGVPEPSAFLLVGLFGCAIAISRCRRLKWSSLKWTS